MIINIATVTVTAVRHNIPITVPGSRVRCLGLVSGGGKLCDQLWRCTAPNTGHWPLMTPDGCLKDATARVNSETCTFCMLSFREYELKCSVPQVQGFLGWKMVSNLYWKQNLKHPNHQKYIVNRDVG